MLADRCREKPRHAGAVVVQKFPAIADGRTGLDGGTAGSADRHSLGGKRNVIVGGGGVPVTGRGEDARRAGILTRNAIPGAGPSPGPHEAPPGHERGEPALQRAPADRRSPSAPPHGVDSIHHPKAGRQRIHNRVEFRLPNLLRHLRVTRLFGAITDIVPRKMALIWRDYALLCHR